MTTPSAPERVAAGVELLDKVKPGWRGLIRLDLLDMRSTCSCVLGQLFDDYYRGLRLLAKTEQAVGDFDTRHGFNSIPSTVDADTVEASEADFDALQACWEAALSREDTA